MITQSQQQTSNTPATGTPGIDGSPLPGQTLTANTSGIQDEDGMTGAVFAYQWLADDAPAANATASTYAVAAADVGKALKVRVTFIDDAGNAESLTSYAALASQSQIFLDEDVSNAPATGAPGMDGSPLPGQTLTANTSGIQDEEGMTGAVFAYQWLADDAPAANATASTYAVAAADVGKALKVRVTFTDYAGNSESLTSAATAAVSQSLTRAAEPANTPATGAPGIDGSPVVGQTLTATTSDIGDDDGITNAVFAYQWLASDAAIQGATASTYAVAAADVGKALKVTVTFTDDEGNAETLTSAATAAAVPANTPATGVPGIGGSPVVGQTLTATTSNIGDDDGITNAVFAYQWLASDAAIDSATASTYTVTAADASKGLKVRVTFTDDAGNSESLTSAATTAVAAVVPSAPGGLSVSVNGTGKLDVSWSVPASNGGSAVTGYKVQWKETAGSWDTPSDVSETTATGNSHTVSGLTDGAEYTFRVVAVNSVGENPASTEESGTPKETTAPTVSSATVDEAALTLIFNEGLTETPLPAATAFRASVVGTERGVSSVAISGSTVTLTLASAATYSDEVSVSYTVPSEATAARLKDLSDNVAESFANRAVTNNTTASGPPLTASILAEPTSHDGQSVFTFELRFSETPKTTFSYITLRDHAFTVTSGNVTKTRRLEPPGNVRWEITVTPDSGGDVTLVLPVTTGCVSQGAICTEDGRMLSNRLELTVAGPGG